MAFTARSGSFKLLETSFSTGQWNPATCDDHHRETMGPSQWCWVFRCACGAYLAFLVEIHRESYCTLDGCGDPALRAAYICR